MSRMSRYDDFICFLEDMIEFLLCIIMQAATPCVVTLGVLMGAMMYLSSQYRLEESLRLGVSLIHLTAETTGPMPTTTGTSGPPVNLPTYSATNTNMNSTTKNAVRSASYSAKNKTMNDATYSAKNKTMGGTTKGDVSSASYGAKNKTMSDATYGAANRAISDATNRTTSGTTYGTTNRAMNGATNSNPSGATHGPTDTTMTSVIHSAPRGFIYGATNEAISGAGHGTTKGAISHAIADATDVVTTDANNAYLTQTDPYMGTSQSGAGTGMNFN